MRISRLIRSWFRDVKQPKNLLSSNSNIDNVKSNVVKEKEKEKNNNVEIDLNTNELLEPKDKYNLVFCLTLYLGVATLSPFNAIIALNEYYFIIYGSKVVGAINQVLSIPNVIFILLIVKLGKYASIKSRIIFCWVSIAILSICRIFIPFIGNNSSNNPRLYNTSVSFFLISVFLTGTGYAVGQGTAFSFASFLPPKYIQALGTGTSISGLLVPLLWLAITSISNAANWSLSVSAYIFNVIIALHMISGILIYFYVNRLPFTIYWVKNNSQNKNNDIDIAVKAENGQDKCDTNLYNKEENEKEVGSFSEMIHIISIVQKMGLTCFFLMFSTFIVFPTLLIGMRPSNPSLNSYWTKLLLINFSIFDISARFAAGIQYKGFDTMFSEKNIWIPSLIRLIFIPPLLILWIGYSNLISGQNFGNGQQLTDVSVFILYSLLAFTLGYLINLVMMYGSKTGKTQRQCEVASIIMTFCLVFGVFCGNAVSFAINLAKPT